MPRRKKPIALHIAEGTYRPHRHDKEAMKIHAELPECPEWLDKDAQQEWHRVVKAMAPYDILCALDWFALAMYCNLCSEYKRSCIDPSINFNAPKLNQFRCLMNDLSLTVAARPKLLDHQPVKQEDNPFARL